MNSNRTYDSNSRSIILFSSKPSGIIPPIVVDFPSDLASRSTQHHKMFTKKRTNKPSLVCVYNHNGNCWTYDIFLSYPYKDKNK